MSDFYDFKHRCETMPDDVSFCKLKGSEVNLFTADRYVTNSVEYKTIFFGFRFCPYCGKSCDDMEGDDE